MDVTKLSPLQQIVWYFLDWNPKDAPIGAPALQNAGQLLIDNEVGAQEIDADQQQSKPRTRNVGLDFIVPIVVGLNPIVEPQLEIPFKDAGPHGALKDIAPVRVLVAVADEYFLGHGIPTNMLPLQLSEQQ
jgi:hypothetical protein